jgi:hypothetical protein
MKTLLPVIVGLALTGCSASPTKPASPSAVVQPSPSPSSPSSSADGLWTLAFTTESTGERCELAQRQAHAELRCGSAAFAPLKSDASEALKLVEATAWADEAKRAEPEQAGPKMRSFRMVYSQGTVEVLRYAEPSTPFGRLAAALDALVKAEHPAAPVAEPEAPRTFPEVAESGLVTLQGISLVGALNASTIRVGTDGSWTRTGAAPSSGKLDAKQLSALRALIDEAGKAKPSTEGAEPCDAMPMHASRVLFGKGREVRWSGPCMGPPPPAAVQILATYLGKLADGRPASELEQTLARPR